MSEITRKDGRQLITRRCLWSDAMESNLYIRSQSGGITGHFLCRGAGPVHRASRTSGVNLLPLRLVRHPRYRLRPKLKISLDSFSDYLHQAVVPGFLTAKAL